MVPDAGDAVGDRDARQAGAPIKRIVSDAADAAGNRDACQAGAVGERTIPDCGDGQAVDGVGDGRRNAGPHVTGDGDGAVIGRVSEVRNFHIH